MHKTVDVHIGHDILDRNRELARKNHDFLEAKSILSFDFVGSIGSGKTLLIENIIERLKEKGKNAGVIAGDVAGEEDYKRFRKHSVPVVNLNTGKECHLDAHLIEHALEDLDVDGLDVLFIENVGNLVCPGDFPLGTDERVVVVSVTEGDDMIKKHPVIFALSDIIVINKVDLAEAMEVDPAVLRNDAVALGTRAKVIETDAKHGQGIDELMGALGL
ncbi:MAG: hydrogenase nickel incorporation protein HypB [Methanomassiliicoccales archaeon]|nr:MAG: hydrogenase nickel incorporation protein HypB [Methanomassiliicoccales archaeon]